MFRYKSFELNKLIIVSFQINQAFQQWTILKDVRMYHIIVNDFLLHAINFWSILVL